MYSPNYNCELLTGIDQVKCWWYQDTATAAYTLIGYLEILIVLFFVWIVLYKILWRWILRPWFSSLIG